MCFVDATPRDRAAHFSIDVNIWCACFVKPASIGRIPAHAVYAFPANKETPYELNAENRFTELENPFEEGVRLFEEGQIADAALCFEAEIARNPENSQVWVTAYVPGVVRV